MYTKPEIAVLGHVSEVILGTKRVPSFEFADPMVNRFSPPDVELDD